MASTRKRIEYTSSEDVYVDNLYRKAGEPFVTDAPPGKTWKKVSKVEKAAADAQKEIKDDVPLEGLPTAALQAVAVERGVNPKGLSNAELITAIKAADDPTR